MNFHAQAIANPAQGVVNGIAGFGVNAAFDAASHWVANGASWLLDAVGSVLNGTTKVPIGTSWFGAHESVMAALAAAVVSPLACCAVIQAVLHQNLSVLTRSLLLHLPLALLLTGVAVELVRLGLALTDALSARVMAAGGADAHDLLRPLSQALTAGSVTGPAVPTFVLFVAGLLTALAALGLWLELVVRAAAVTAATLFLPLALAALVWPAVAHWCRRLADTLVALILSKLVIAAVLSLAAGALAGGLGVSAGNGGGVSSVVTGVALLLVATTAPFTLLRLVPAVEAGAVSHLESARHRFRQNAQAPGRAANLALDVAAAAGTGGGAGLAALAAGGAAAASNPPLSSLSNSGARLPTPSGTHSTSTAADGSAPGGLAEDDDGWADGSSIPELTTTLPPDLAAAWQESFGEGGDGGHALAKALGLVDGLDGLDSPYGPDEPDISHGPGGPGGPGVPGGPAVPDAPPVRTTPTGMHGSDGG